MSETLIMLGIFILIASGMFGAGFKAGLRLIGAIITAVGIFWATIITLVARAILIAAVILFFLAVVAIIRSLFRHRRERRRREREWPYDPFGPGNPYDWH